MGWKGGFARRPRRARAGAPFVHSPLASQSIGRLHLALCRRHAHSATDPTLVKKCNANLSSLPSHRRVSLHGSGTATPLRGFISPASVFPCIGTGRVTIWACVVRPGSLQATAELRRCRAGPCGKLVGEVHPPAREAPPWEGPRRSGRTGAIKRVEEGCQSPFRRCQWHSALCSHSDRVELVGNPFLYALWPAFGELEPAGVGSARKMARNRGSASKNPHFRAKKNPPRKSGEGGVLNQAVQ